MKALKIENMSWWLSILLILAGTLLFLIVYALMQGLSSVFSNDIVAVIAGFALGGVTLALYALYIRLTENGWTSTLSLRQFPLKITTGILTGAVFFVIVTGVMALGGWYRIGSAAFSSAFYTQLSFFFLVACGEEVIFRGIVFRYIDKRWNTLWALAVSALLFGVLHIFNEEATIWSVAAIAIEAGLMLGMAYKVSGTLWLPIGIHWAWNVLEGPVLGFAVSGTNDSSIIKPVITGPEIITGGTFGAEASVFAIIVGVMITACMWYLWIIKSR
jgi:membrane protease YdiL (CAAX protease family)